MATGVEGGEALLVGGFGGCLDVVGAVGAALDDLLTAIETEIIAVVAKFATEASKRDDKFCFHTNRDILGWTKRRRKDRPMTSVMVARWSRGNPLRISGYIAEY